LAWLFVVYWRCAVLVLGIGMREITGNQRHHGQKSKSKYAPWRLETGTGWHLEHERKGTLYRGLKFQVG